MAILLQRVGSLREYIRDSAPRRRMHGPNQRRIKAATHGFFADSKNNSILVSLIWISASFMI
jgi:hypothetical protein